MDKLKQVIKLKQEGKTVNQIGELLSIGKGTVGYYLKKAREEKINYIRNNEGPRSFTKEELKTARDKKKKTWKLKLLNTSFEELSWEGKRKRVIIEQKDECSKCKNSHWLGKKLILEVDHIDGNRHNNSRENLKGLCPNCHSLTNTWRGRNKSLRYKISDEKFKNSLRENKFNIYQSLISLKLAPKGGNYKRAYRLIDEIYLE